jgi:cytochrome c5
VRKALLLALFASASLSAQQLPAGAGAGVLKSRCLICHEADVITSQKLSLTGWINSVNKMVRWGSQITADERAVLQPYLAQHFGPLRQGYGGQAPMLAASHNSTGLPTVASAEVGAATYKKACLTCHDADIIEQQRLTPAGWTRSVEKMMRWGAAVSDAEKQPLIDHLASRFGPR